MPTAPRHEIFSETPDQELRTFGVIFSFVLCFVSVAVLYGYVGHQAVHTLRGAGINAPSVFIYLGWLCGVSVGFLAGVHSARASAARIAHEQHLDRTWDLSGYFLRWAQCLTRFTHRSRKPLAAVALILAIGGFFHWSRREPHIEGKPMSHWLSGYASVRAGIGITSFGERAANVLRKNHEQAIPHLIALLRSKGDHEEPNPDEHALNFADLHPASVHRRLPWETRHRAAEALGRMGPLAVPAIPELKRIARDPDDYACSTANSALGQIGGEGMRFLIQSLRQGTTDQQCLACWGMLDAKILPSDALLLLRDAITNGVPDLRAAAYQTLSHRKLDDADILNHLLPKLAGPTTNRTARWLRSRVRATLLNAEESRVSGIYRTQGPAGRERIVELVGEHQPDLLRQLTNTAHDSSSK